MSLNPIAPAALAPPQPYVLLHVGGPHLVVTCQCGRGTLCFDSLADMVVCPACGQPAGVKAFRFVRPEGEARPFFEITIGPAGLARPPLRIVG